jgi:replication-associated recombination protein RarA
VGEHVRGHSDGDARRALNALELAVMATEPDSERSA